MRTIVDTSSLVRMAQSYQPFDNTQALETFLSHELKNGELILLDKVADEIRYVSKGIAFNTFKCLQDRKNIRSTSDLMPSKKFYNMLDNSFVNVPVRNLTLKNDDTAYQNERDAYLQSTDCTLIVYANQQKDGNFEPIQILTEETSFQNDNKLFRKIPFICSVLGIPTTDVVQYLKQHQEELVVEVKAT